MRTASRLKRFFLGRESNCGDRMEHHERRRRAHPTLPPRSRWATCFRKLAIAGMLFLPLCLTDFSAFVHQFAPTGQGLATVCMLGALPLVFGAGYVAILVFVRRRYGHCEVSEWTPAARARGRARNRSPGGPTTVECRAQGEQGESAKAGGVRAVVECAHPRRAVERAGRLADHPSRSPPAIEVPASRSTYSHRTVVQSNVQPRLRGHRYACALWLLVLGSVVGSAQETGPQSGDPRDVERIDGLLARLRSTDPRARQAAVGELGQLGPRAGRAVPDLLEAFESADEMTCLAAAGALARLGESVLAHAQRLSALLRDGRRIIRRQSGMILLAVDPDGRTSIPALLGALNDPSRDVRQDAADMVGRSGRLSEAWVSRIVEELHNPDPDVRAWLVRGLCALGANGIRAATLGLKDSDPQVRMQAAYGLGDLGPGAADAVPALILALGDPETGQAVADTLARVGPPAGPGLIAALRHPDAPVRARASFALRYLAKEVPEVMTALEPMLKDPSPEVRHQAARSLGWCGAGAVEHLEAALGDAHPSVRWGAAYGLSLIGPAARQSLGAVLRLIADPDEFVQASAIWALPAMGAVPEDVLPSLRRASRDPSPTVRRAVLETLERFGPSARDGLDLIENARRDPDENVRGAAEKARERVR